MQPHVIAVLAFDDISPFHLSVPCIVFGADHHSDNDQHIDLIVCAAETGALRTSAGFTIQVNHGLETLTSANTIVIPSWPNAALLPSQILIDALRAAHARGARIVGLCLGAFVLAAVGLLDGREATTHWLRTEAMARAYPRIVVNPNVLYVDNGDVLTSAGTAAGIDCCLHILRQLRGADVANHVARCMIVAPHRQGGQAQYIERFLPESSGDDRFLDVLNWVGENLHLPHTLDTLTEKALMSRRTFTRRFKQITGTTVVQWIRHQRLAFAQRLLETSDHPIETIAELSGFNSALSLRQHFGKILHTSPSTYRREFRGHR